MNIDQLPYVGRRAFFLDLLGLLGVAAVVGGCGDDQGTQATATADNKAKEDAERDARVKAFGKTAQPGKPGSKPKS